MQTHLRYEYQSECSYVCLHFLDYMRKRTLGMNISSAIPTDGSIILDYMRKRTSDMNTRLGVPTYVCISLIIFANEP